MTATRHGTAVIEFPSELEVLITRKFEAPIQLVYDVLTTTEHVRNTIAPFGEVVTECTFDARVGGSYRYTFLAPDDGRDMTFHGEFLEVQAPTHLVDTWLYDGWPDVKAVETIDLSESDGVTTIKWLLTFADKAGRDHMTKFDGIEANFDNVEDYLRRVLDKAGAAA
jgi:uncharacterized protein YndB with AHSA1/START domain